ncbi:RHS repeat-associated core domain-containing protein [Pseudomonas sp. Eth.TT006]
MNVHWRTPSLIVNDSRGLPVRQVAYLRSFAEQTNEPAIALVTRQTYDHAARLIEQRDPRLPHPNITTVYDLNAKPLKIDSADLGRRVDLLSLAGQTIERWEGRGSHWRSTFDNQLRVLSVENTTQPDLETCTYADGMAQTSHNLRGRLIEIQDQSGSLHYNGFSLSGDVLEETRTFADGQAFSTRYVYGPQGRVLERHDAGGHRQRSRYNLAGQLLATHLQINGQAAWQPVLQYARYNAAGQITQQLAGNDVLTQWHYDAADGRLRRHCSGRASQPFFQDFAYEYDRCGNITRIVDHTFTLRHVANQRINGDRTFVYDSLYRPVSATGHDAAPAPDIPGLPRWNATPELRQYVQTYTYDHGNNLIKLQHVREGASHTQEMFIDPASNRGVRWKAGDPVPDIASLFDAHGNLLQLQPGCPVHWNARDQLTRVTLVKRDDGPDDEEIYRYSQGTRVYKRHDTHTATLSHFQEVRYLPGLEVRTRDTGETLHVITLEGGFANVRCLHWTAGKPAGIDDNQIRYTLDDHLGSCLMELDQQARIISCEGHYTFGGTAWFVGSSAIEVSYKTVRYSGKEMDASGLYYYGARYYAPSLQRWVQPDPMGSVDGLNLYCMTGNNPINFFDKQGTTKTESTALAMGMNPEEKKPPPLVVNPAENPPGKLPPRGPWKEQAKDAAVWLANSKIGLALLPTGSSSPATGAIVTTMVASVSQILIHSMYFNPGWSAPGTWDPATGGDLPPKEVTQDAFRVFNQINVAMTAGATLLGAALGPLVGGYVDELRGTAALKNKAKKEEKSGKRLDKINDLIAEQRLLDEVPTRVLNSLHEQVLEVEEATGITWDSMESLEKITRLRSRTSADAVSTQTYEHEVSFDRQEPMRAGIKRRRR